jgi:hypothetical protein
MIFFILFNLGDNLVKFEYSFRIIKVIAESPSPGLPEEY